jgi:hypothetical protein
MPMGTALVRKIALHSSQPAIVGMPPSSLRIIKRGVIGVSDTGQRYHLFSITVTDSRAWDWFIIFPQRLPKPSPKIGGAFSRSFFEEGPLLPRGHRLAIAAKGVSCLAQTRFPIRTSVEHPGVGTTMVDLDNGNWREIAERASLKKKTRRR